MLTQERLKEVLYYNPHVGVFVWKVSKPNRPRGSTAGGPAGKYIKIAVDRKSYQAHHLVWLYVHGRFPAEQIDHIDGDKTNNLISNLREACQKQNSMNLPISARNTSGVKGVSFCNGPGKWCAAIKSGGKLLYRKFFETMEEAESEIRIARERLHGEFCNHGLHKYQKEELLDAE